MVTLLKQEKYSFEFKPSQLRVNGSALINFWGGGQGNIEMDSFSLSVSDIKGDEDLLKQIKENANDGGHGCESIERLEDIQVDVLSNSDSMILVTDSIFFDEIEI